MGDEGWLGPDTCGVKLTDFEHMTRQMSAAAPKLADLADALWQALNGAGASTAPAMEIKRIAAWADRAATDLRRRNQLAHDLDRQKIAMVVCRQDGNYLKLPDRYTDQVAYGDGRRTADLFRRAASGDAAARTALRRMTPDDLTPAFAKGLLEALGPEELLKLPMALVQRLAGDVRQHRDGVDASAADTRAILALLGTSLALATNSGKRGYVGDNYLKTLRLAGRTNFPPLSKPPNGTSGYQSLATLLGSAGDARFSTRFMAVVGNDMIAYDGALRKDLGQLPLPGLAGKAGLGNALDPSTTKVKPDDRKTDILVPLLLAAANSGKEASQTLLNHRPVAGPFEKGTPSQLTTTNLKYLLHDRRPVWGEADHGAALGRAIQTAATGQDKESTALAFAVSKILADDARKIYVVKDGKVTTGEKGPFDELTDGDLGDMISRPRHYDELSGLRPAMATVLVAHMDKLHDIVRLSGFTEKAGSTGLTGEDLDYLLLDLTRDSAAYEKLLLGQIAHAKLAIDRTVKQGGDLSNTIAGEGRMFGHLLEARHQAVGAEEGRLAEDKARMEKFVGFGIGLLPLDNQRAGAVPVVGKLYTEGVGQLSGRLTKWFAKKLADEASPTVKAPHTETEAVERLFNQMIASSMVTHREIPPTDLAGKPFATEGDPPKVRPLSSMDAVTLGSS